MRVVHVSYEFPPCSTGGLGTYLAGLVAHQHRCGDSVDVLYLGEPPVPPGCIHLPGLDHGTFLHYSLDEIAERTGTVNYDVLVCQDWPGVLASHPLWKLGIPLVYHCHLPLAWDIGWYDDIPCEFSTQAEFAGVAFADVVIAVSAAVSRELQQHYKVAADRIRVVHNGTDTEFFTPPPDETPRNRQTLLYVGRYTESKGFDLLPDIFALIKREHPAAVLELIGVGDWDVGVRKKFDTMGLSDDVVWHPFSPLDTVRALYRRATAVLMPSRFEAFGLVAAEAMACGAALVAMDTGGLSEFITHDQTGLLVSPGDVGEFARQASVLLSDGETRTMLGRNARDFAVRELSQARSYDRIRDELQTLIHPQRGGDVR